MEPIFFSLAWLAYVVLFWTALILFDLRQEGARRQWLNSVGKFLRRLYARGRSFAAPQ
jgi:hypothetical protein